MKKRTKILTAAAAATVAVLAATGTVLAVGSDGDDAQLTGSTLDQAAEVALAETGPGRVTSAERDDDGSYELEIVRPDGTEVDAHLDADLKTVRTEVDGDRSDSSDDDGPDADDLTGEPLRKATAAAEAEVPDGIVTDAERAGATGYELSVVRPDGTEVDVVLDSQFQVVSATPDLDD